MFCILSCHSRIYPLALVWQQNLLKPNQRIQRPQIEDKHWQSLYQMFQQHPCDCRQWLFAHSFSRQTHGGCIAARLESGSSLVLALTLTARCLQIGRDPRISGPLLAAALAAGLTSKGVTVARFGYATTPAMFMSTIIEGETWLA